MSYIKAHNYFLLRKPLLPIDKLMNSLDSLENDNFVYWEKQLRQIYSEPLLQEAIYLASPDFYKEFKKWLDNTEVLSAKDNEKIVLTLYKYFVRMSTRPTPYGLFAGCLLGEVSDSSAIRFEEGEESIVKKSRLDMNYLTEMVKFITNQDEVKHQIKFYKNSSLYQLGDKYRYTEAKVINKHRRYFLSSVSVSEPLAKILEFSRKGATIKEYCLLLVSDEISYEEAQNYVEQLIEAQILVSELEPTITGDEFFDVLINKLKNLIGTQSTIDVLLDIQTLLKEQDSEVLKYEKVNQLIRENFVKTSSKDLIQTDLFFKAEQCQISHQVIDEITQSVQKLFHLAPRSVSSDLDNFRKRFYERYEEQEIPLLIALDNESGLGYGAIQGGQAENTPLVDDLVVPSRNKNSKINWSGVENLTFKLYLDAIENHKQSVEITDTDFAAFENSQSKPKIPDSLYAFGNILSSSLEDIQQGDFKFNLAVLSGPSAGNLFARFAHGSEKLKNLVTESLSFEENYNPDAIYTEVIHLPEARVGNILMRPAFRSYEIPFLGNSSKDDSHQIPLDDILISVPYGSRIVLRSKKLNKEIIPRLTSAHNYSTGLGVYRFLCDLQKNDYNSTFMWDWGVLNDKVFLPRVEYKKIIVSRARWKVRSYNYKELTEKTIPSFSFWKNLQSQLSIPRFTVMTEGDNELLIDFEAESSHKILFQRLKKKGFANLVEFLPTPENCFLEDSKGKYANEILLPLYANNPIKKKNLINIQPDSAIQRTFTPNSEWFYIKIYCGVKSAERILCDVIKPLSQELFQLGVIDKWFFIRFKDSDEHLRVRFHNKNKNGFGQYVLSALDQRIAEYISTKQVYKLQIDTYNREIERYGAATIDLCESWFFHDSEAVVSFIDLLDGGEEGEKYRWLFALKGIDMLLNDFKLSIHQKSDLLQNLQEGFFKEFNGDVNLTVALNNKYRADFSEVSQILEASDLDESLSEAISCFTSRSEKTKELIETIYWRSENDPNAFSPTKLLPSLIHMFLNRLFIAKHRLHELVIYHYLDKYYKSKIARLKKTSNTSISV